MYNTGIHAYLIQAELNAIEFNISPFGHKIYLEGVTVKNLRIALLQLRKSSHILEAEAGLAAGQDLYGNQLLKGYVFYVMH